MKASVILRRITLLVALAGCAPGEETVSRARLAALPDLPPMQRFGDTVVTRPARSNADMAQNFLDLTFRLESGRDLPVLTRFEGPVGIALAGAVPPTASRDLSNVVARLRREAGLDLSIVGRSGADITIEFLPRRVMQREVPAAACFVAPRVGSWAEYRSARRETVDWVTLTTRDRAAIFVPNDTAPQEIRDCLHEELGQALGPLNDLYELPDSVFNDDNVHNVLTGFDMLMLSVTYAPELRSGMTRAEVAERLPAILSRLNPRGDRLSGIYPDPTPDAFSDAIAAGLGPRTFGPRRLPAARRAVAIAQERGWRDARAGFAWLALGRIALGSNSEEAEAAFARSSAIYHAAPGLALHAAHADMQLAAFALARGDYPLTLALTEDALPRASAGENAALLSGLLMLRAEALDLAGRSAEARQVRLDSLAWGRYGFASDADVWARFRNIAGLSPARRVRQE